MLSALATPSMLALFATLACLYSVASLYPVAILSTVAILYCLYCLYRQQGLSPLSCASAGQALLSAADDGVSGVTIKLADRTGGSSLFDLLSAGGTVG